MKANLLSITGEVKGEIEVPETIFNTVVNEGLLWEVCRNYLANQRQGTASTKTRGEVRGGGRKPWAQKHTGRARHGSRRSPLWVGGGKVFGPKPRDYHYRLPKAKKRKALLSALSFKMQKNEILFLEDFSLPQPKTREIANILKNLSLGLPRLTCLLLLADLVRDLKLASRNIKNLEVKLAKDVNPYEVLVSDRIIFTQSGLQQLIQKFFGKEDSNKG